jgi:hypothetical protein
MVAKRQKENYNIKVRKLFLQTKQKNKAKLIVSRTLSLFFSRGSTHFQPR